MVVNGWFVYLFIYMLELAEYFSYISRASCSLFSCFDGPVHSPGGTIGSLVFQGPLHWKTAVEKHCKQLDKLCLRGLSI